MSDAKDECPHGLSRLALAEVGMECPECRGRNRVTLTIEWMAALAKLGVKGGLDITIEAAPDEWAAWEKLASNGGLEVAGPTWLLEMWGPAGILLHVVKHEAPTT